MAWLRDKDGVDPDSQEILRLFPIPVRVAVPTEVQEARANLFVSLLAVPTEKLAHLKHNSRQLPLPLVDQ